MNNCPRCQRINVDQAGYCSRCGFDLRRGQGLGAGLAPCAHPLAAPPGYRKVESAADLWYLTEAPHGGPPLLDTEGARVTLFNAGYSLCDVSLLVRGAGPDGRAQFEYEELLPLAPQGAQVSFEAPSSRMTVPLSDLRIALRSAQYFQDHAA